MHKVIIFLVVCFAIASAQDIKVFFHGGRDGSELAALESILGDFNSSQRLYKASVVALPEGDYLDHVLLAGVSGELPCLLDLDGPTLYNFIWSGFLQPIDSFIPESTKADMLPSILQQGTYEGQLYSLGMFDSGMAIWGNKRLLEQAGVRIPASVEDAWTLNEFNDVLKAISTLPSVEYAIDFKLNYGEGEWYTYGFSPIVQSFGGDLINRNTYQNAQGILNSPESVAALSWFQSLFKDGLATLTPTDDNDFINGKAALSWVGNWVYGPYSKALGEDLVLIPMPKLGEKAVTAMGSWNWGITKHCDNVEGAAELLNFLLEPDNIRKMTEANGAVPSRISVLRENVLYTSIGPLSIYGQQLLSDIAVPRPETAAYLVITDVFARAITTIINGADVQTTLDEAASAIEQSILDNNGYR